MGRTELKFEITPAAVRDQLSRIIASDVFNDSPRMARFLRFTVEETLRGNAAQLKETVIGTQVFDRASSYDPRLDPIVRVEARRLRAKLQTYYEGFGKRDSLLLELPKGHYAPVFRMRAGAEPDARESAERENTTTVAVLPFANLDPGAGTEFLSDGLTEDLINALTRIPQLQIVAWNSVAQLKGQEDELEAIRQRLDVAYVIRGSIRQRRDQVRICAYLIDTVKRHYVWSEVYNRTLHDIFKIQEEIAASIQNALQLKFAPAVRLRGSGRPQDVQSYQLCLKGRFHARERTAEGLQRSLVCFEQAIAADPESSAAHAGLADTHTLLAEYGFADGPTYMEKAKAAVQRALELDPTSAEALASFGFILTIHNWAWEAAQNAFERSLELNPGYASAYHWYGIDHLAMLGQFDDAERKQEMAIKLDPLSPIMMEGRGYLRLLVREYDDAIRVYSGTVASDPSFYKSHTSMGRIYIQKGEYAKAIELLQKGLTMAGEVPSILGALGQAYGLSGQRSEANRMLTRLAEMAESRAVPSSCFALVHLGMGETDAALTWLERGVQRHEASVITLKVHPAYDPLRGEARFQALLAAIGFDRAILP
jgi:TolB-like protein/tetratricopeptide (TPR) repeat protein